MSNTQTLNWKFEEAELELTFIDNGNGAYKIDYKFTDYLNRSLDKFLSCVSLSALDNMPYDELCDKGIVTKEGKDTVILYLNLAKERDDLLGKARIEDEKKGGWQGIERHESVRFTDKDLSKHIVITKKKRKRFGIF